MKMNWGNKLVVVFVAFAALIGTLVYKSVNTKYELVSKDYYKDELRYQDKIDGKVNADKLSGLAIVQNSESLTIVMPKEVAGHKLDGELWFYCPTDATKDKKISLNLTPENLQVISKKEVVKGKYHLKLSWKEGTENFFIEKELVVE
jgi:hypothetical protein